MSRPAKTLWIHALLISVLLGVAATAEGQTASSDWATVTPDSVGMDSELLELMRSVIDESGLPVDGLVVVRNGQIAFEHYPNAYMYDADEMHILYSTTKSVTSILIGIAIDHGFIGSVDDRVVDYFQDLEIENLDDRKERMTIEHLLTMTSGLEWEGPDDMHHSWGQALRSGNPWHYTLNQPMSHEPGEHFLYNGGCSHLLSAILTRASGMSTWRFARDYLFAPLGIQRFVWPVDPTGIYYGGQDIWLTPRDMARLGQLFLDDGLWNGERIVSESWVDASSQPLVDNGSAEYGYGYQWWVLPEGTIYKAWGALDQHIFVVPDLDVVVAVTSDNQVPNQAPGELREGILLGDWLLSRFIMPACDDYEPFAYADHGVVAEFPRAVASRVRGIDPGDSISSSAGLLKGYHPYSPFEIVRLQWEETPSSNSEEAAEGYVQLLRDVWGPAAVSTTDLGAGEVDGHPAVLLGYRVDVPPIAVHEGAIAAWYCQESGRQFVATSGIEGLPNPSDLLDPVEDLKAFLSTVDCHP